MTRRTMLKAVMFGGLNQIFPLGGLTHSQSITGRIKLQNTKTDEELDIRYLMGNRFNPLALGRLNHLFRYRNGAIHTIDPRLFVLMDIIHSRLKAKERPFLLLSGYRPPKKRFSYHQKGMAADLFIEGISLKELRNTAIDLHVGGVGYYSSWVHVDVGPFRTWTKK